MEPSNAINWFELPVADFERARRFYETLFNCQMPERILGPARLGFFPYDNKSGKVGGAIVYNPGLYTPTQSGTLVYLNCQPDLQVMLDKVSEAGGEIVMHKTLISSDEHLGYWALIIDTEGNRVALHSMS